MGLRPKDDPSATMCSAKPHGEPCGNRALVGLGVCRIHGGSTKASKAKSAEAKAEKALQAFIEPIAKDHPLANPIAAFEWEYRRTVGRILWYDEQLAKLDAEDMEWGLAKHETGAGTLGIPNTTYEARENTLHALQFRERQHLIAMTKQWIGARMDERKLNIQAQYVKALDNAIVGILTRLGQDVADPGVRQVVREELLALPR